MIPSPAQRVARERFELLGEDPQQGRLAAAVGADHADPLAARDDQLDVEQHRLVAVARVDAFEREHALAAARAAAQRERHLAPLEHGPVDLLHAVDLHLLHARLARRPLVDADVRPVPEAPHRVLEARDLLLLGDVRLPLALELELARDDVRAVVARPHADRAAVELGDLRHRRVEQVPVVGDHHDRAVELVEQVAEPLAARHVQVRLGLVEQQHVGPPRQARGERDELALAAGELARGHLQLRPVDPERPQVAERLALRRGRRRPRSTSRARARDGRAPSSSRRGRERGAGRRAAAPRAWSSCFERLRAPGRAALTVVSGSRSSPSTICGRYACTSPRRYVTLPSSAYSRPAMIFSIVDLPPPLGPSTPIRDDASTSRSSPWRIARPPKDLVRPRAASCGTDGDDMRSSVVNAAPASAMRLAAPRRGGYGDQTAIAAPSADGALLRRRRLGPRGGRFARERHSSPNATDRSTSIESGVRTSHREQDAADGALNGARARTPRSVPALAARSQRGYGPRMAPAIHVGPEPPLEHLVEAVEEGGGEIASLADAEAVVWAGSPEELPAAAERGQVGAAAVRRDRAVGRAHPRHAGGAVDERGRRLRDAGGRACARAAARRHARHPPVRARARPGRRRTSGCSRARRSRSSARAGSGRS